MNLSLKENREIIKQKFNGLCAYSGTVLKDDWQIDHLISKRNFGIYWDGRGEYKEYLKKVNNVENLMPCQRRINHYKGTMDIDTFRNDRINTLHERLKKLPKNPKTEKSKKHKEYLLDVAKMFNITVDKPFSGKFYFEILKK